MAKRLIDRRTARTRAALQRALNSLIMEKDYEAITVKEICDAAKVARSTFYAHYPNKDAVKRSGFDPLRRQLVDRQRDAHSTSHNSWDQRFGFSLAMLQHARDHRHHYRALVDGRGGTVSLETIRQILCDVVRRDLAATKGRGGADAVPRDLVVEYVVGAFMSVMIWWLEGGAKLPPEQVNTIFRRLAIQGVVQSSL